MSSFKFNFCSDANDSRANETKQEDEKKGENIDWLKCVEVLLGDQMERLDEIAPHAKMFTCGDVEIGHVVAKEALLRIVDNNIENAVELAENEHSDLIAGKYEGGLKIWECTYDLIEYLIANDTFLRPESKKVLDLGCGAGILGIYALMNGANVTFQDYNKEVLECVTIPNILLNSDEEDKENDITKCKFYSGDWASFNEKLPDTETFDIILTSETIYNVDNYSKLINLFLKRLNKDGVVFVAAKTCYFGVGGGTRLFEVTVNKNPLLKSKVCWKSSGGIQREIIEITRNQDLFIID